MSFGVLSTGFSQKLISDILAEFEAQQKADFGPDINTGGESVLGQLNATFGASVAEGWEVLAAVYRSIYPNSASGEALDQVSSITGVTRLPATPSTVVIECAGTAGVILLAGRVVSADSTGERFVLVEDTVIGGGGTVDALFESENLGPIPLSTGQAITIETPVAGWTGATVAEDAEPGTELEDDAAFRLRRASLLQVQGTATIEAIRADLFLVEGVTQAFVFENVSLVTDGRNLPPKSIECIVQGGTDVAVAEAIFNTKAAGIETYGHAPNDVTETVTDSMEIDHTINFTRPDEVQLYCDVTVTYDPDEYPLDGDQQIKDALAALADGLGLGDTLIYERFQAEVFQISGVIDIPAFTIDDTPTPTGTSNITFDVREIAILDSANVDVTSSPA